MNNQQNLITVRGYVVALPKWNNPEDQALPEGVEEAKVAVQEEGGAEYLIVPRGMGIDLGDHINAGVEVSGLLLEKGEYKLIQVRQYQVKDEYDDHWYDDKD